MSARVLYLRRGERGGLLRGVRLVGETSDESWPPHGDATGGAADVVKAAGWVRERLANTRSTSSIAMLCVDAEGTACTWLSSPTAEREVVSAVARFGASPDGSRGGGNPVDFYAPSDSEATIQAVDEDPGLKRSKAALAAGAKRRAVLSVSDAPARAMIDGLDALGVPVEAAAGVAHLMAMVWDPGSKVGRASLVEGGADVATDAGPVTAILMQDGAGRLLWCWSRGGRMLACGAVRLRVGVLEPALPGDARSGYVCGADEASRLATEWLAWAAQLGESPGRAVCVLPEADEAAAFGGALTRLLPGVAVDVAQDEDAIGTTLRRAAGLLEHTPRANAPAPSGASTLLALSARPGRRHRQMYVWRAAALTLLAGAIGLGGWRLQRQADEAKAAGNSWNSTWRDLLKSEFPDALRPRPGVSPVTALTDEVRRRQRDLVPPERTELTMPVLAEIETISMVIGHKEIQLESMDVGSTSRVTVVLVVPTLREAESIVESLKRIGGSFVGNWTPTYTEKIEGFASQPGGTSKKIRVTLRGDWDIAAVKAQEEAGAKSAGGKP